MPSRHVAVIGSGPAGAYCAAALIERADVSIDILDRLPTPYGLVRYGVAPDHVKMKSVTNALCKVFMHGRVRFLGNVEVGRDISLAGLRRHYDAIILANGAAADRRLGIDGEDLPGSFAATEFVSWYNGHPDTAIDAFTLAAQHVVVVGLGNVAIDVARVLLKPADTLRSTDIPDQLLDVLANSRVREVTIVGRRGPAYAKFTTKELRELGELDNVDVIVSPAELELDEAGRVLLEHNPVARRNLDVLREWSQRAPQGRPRRLYLRFCLRPVAISGSQAVTGMTFARAAPGGSRSAADPELPVRLPAELVLRSVGYRGLAIPGIPFDAERGVLPHAAGRVLRDGVPLPGVYAAGWIKRGPSGIIGTNKTDANETVRSLLEDTETLPPREVTDRSRLLAELAERGVQIVDWCGWESIEAQEIAGGRARNAARVKLVGRDRMLAAARD